jgi:hypothetical protein
MKVVYFFYIDPMSTFILLGRGNLQVRTKNFSVTILATVWLGGMSASIITYGDDHIIG